MNIHEVASQSVQDIMRSLQTSLDGLTSKEVAQRRVHYGFNEVAQERYYLLKLLLRQCKTPFMYLIGIAMGIAWMLSDYVEVSFMALFALINIVLGWFQEWKAHKAVQLLRSYTTIKVRVLRDKAYKTITQKELVPGDIIVLQAGDGIPADVRFVQEQDLMVDESTMTGESMPVKKLAEPDQSLPPEVTIGYTATIVVQGKATAIVVATGIESTGGKILHQVQAMKTASNVMQEMKEVSRWVLFFVIGGIAVVMLLHLLLKGNQTHWSQLLLFAMALAITMTPESLPVIITFCLSRGTFLLARRKVIVKRLSAIQDLGNVNLLCSDKTGTLTENKLEVAEIYGDPDVLIYAALAGSLDKNGNHDGTNPIDVAFWNALSPHQQQKIKEYGITYQVPFDPFRLRNTAIVQDGNTYVITRGTLESTLECLSAVQRKQKTAEWQEWTQKQETAGNRVIGIAAKKIDAHADFKKETHEEYDLEPIGLIALVDPIKSDVMQALKRAQQLGIQIKILTGDSVEVSSAVAQQIGLPLDHIDNMVITGAEFRKKSETEQEKIVEQCVIFARVNPLDKYDIIRQLQKKYSVGYLGEGINDASALNVADVGIVVQGAAYIAQEAADIILLKKSLNVIMEGIYQGRAVFINTVKYIKIMLIGSVGNFYSVAVASLLIPFLPMSPLQIIMANILTNIPLLSLATDTVAWKEVKRPQHYKLWNLSGFIIVLGLASSMFDALLFWRYYTQAAQLQTAWFLESVLTELVLIFSLRTMRPFWKAAFPSWNLLLLVTVIAIITVTLPFMPFGHTYLQFITPTQEMFVFIASLVIGYFVTTEVVKLLYVRYILKIL